MEIHLLHIFAFLTSFYVAACAAGQLVATHAALPPETYWNSMLPNTPMPKAISDILHPDLMKDKSTSVSVGKGGVNIDANGFIRYLDVATDNQLHDDPNVFFLEKDMLPGTKINWHITKYSNEATFLPRQVAKSIPFSSSKLPEILNQFSVKLGSVEADMIKKTIEQCEKPGIRGEEKYCATSLESMVDFSISKLGKHVRAISTEVGKETKMQMYTVVPGVKKMAGNKTVVCHKQNYPYVVFYCHALFATRAYMMPLESADGTKAKAVAVCHTDTSAWNPKFVALQVLKVKPGTVPVCHFLPEDHVVWVSN